MYHPQPQSFIEVQPSQTVQYTIPVTAGTFYSTDTHYKEVRSPTSFVVVNQQPASYTQATTHYVDISPRLQTTYGNQGGFETHVVHERSTRSIPQSFLNPQEVTYTAVDPQSYLVVNNHAPATYAISSPYISNTVQTRAYTTFPAQVDTLGYLSLPSDKAEEKPKSKGLSAGYQLSNGDNFSQPSPLLKQNSTQNLNIAPQGSSSQLDKLRLGYNGEVVVSSVLERFSFDGKRASEIEINPRPVTGPILLNDQEKYKASSSPKGYLEDSKDTPNMIDLDKKVLSILGKSSMPTAESPTKAEKRPSIFGIANIDSILSTLQTGYEGEKNDGVPHGRGKMTFSDGRVLEGEFFEGKANGYGKLYYENSGICYEGQYVDDKFEGEGKLYNTNPKNLDTTFDYKDFCELGRYWVLYVGDFKNGKKNGVGTLYLSNGEKYYGEFKDNKIEGKGCYYFKGEAYGVAGEWVKNKLIQLF